MGKARDLANIISGGFTFDDIPNIPASKITSGTIDNARISLDAAEIPNLNTSKITAGTLDVARIPDMNASKITAGTFPDARLPSTALNSNVDLTNLSASNLTSGTVADARLPATALNSNVDLTNLSASNLTSGTVADARLPSTALNSNVDLTNLSASNMTSGTLPDARFPATLPAISAANLTNLPASGAVFKSTSFVETSSNRSLSGSLTTHLSRSFTISSGKTGVVICTVGLMSPYEGAAGQMAGRFTISGAQSITGNEVTGHRGHFGNWAGHFSLTQAFELTTSGSFTANFQARTNNGQVILNETASSEDYMHIVVFEE
jgi:hypothetical protein